MSANHIQRANPETTHIGWIGTGVMGASMCGHLLRAGYAVSLHSRTREKAAGLLAQGAAWAPSPRAVAEASDIVFTMVGFPADVRAVVLGEAGVLAGCRAGAILADMTTSQPALAVELASLAEAAGVCSLDAPVSGGDIGARNATLSIMIGGAAQGVAAVLPCLERLGKTIVHQGGPGAGQHAKMANQVLVAGGMVSICEALLYAYRAGLDLETVLRSVASGAAGSWALSNLAPRILANDFAPGFFVEHFVKDLGIVLDEARRMNLALPGVALAHQLYVALQAQGHGRDGTQALQLALASLSGLEWRQRRP